MLRAYRNWDFPKGVVEPAEEPLAAAIREVQEETLIDELQFNWGEVYRETAPYSHKKEWRWVTFEEGLALCSPRLDPIMRWAGETLGLVPKP
jgi:8-oxo-dGTP pyrophosphatase MutT (NUDIX family)